MVAVLALCVKQIALTRAGVIRQHEPVRARCSGSGLPPSRCILSRPGIVSAGDLNQLPVSSVPPASITNDSHSGAHGRGTWMIVTMQQVWMRLPTTYLKFLYIPLSSPTEPPELVFPPDGIQSVRVLKRV